MALGADGPARAVGTATTADEERIDMSGPPATFSDGRFVVVTAAGTAQVRDVATGGLRRTVPMSPASGLTVVAYDGWLYSHDEADRTNGPSTSGLPTWSAGAARTWCRPWRAPVAHGDLISSAHGRTLPTNAGYEFFDAAGRRQFGSALTAGWLDAETLMMVTPDGTGRLARLARWEASTGRMTPFSSHVGDINGNCASTGARLACAGADAEGLRIWDVG